MSKKLTRVGAMILAAMLIVSLAACGSSGTAENNNNASTAATSDATTGTAKKEPITLKVYGGQFGVSFPSGLQTDPVAKEIEKVTGVTIDIDSAPDKTKFQTMMASGDLPDILQVCSQENLSADTFFKPLIEGKKIIPLDELVQTNGKDIVQNVPNMVNYSKKYQSLGTDTLYFLFGYVDNAPKQFTWQVSPNIRWDYYKELGFPDIKNGDDWLNVVDQMAKKHPATDDGKKIYGFSPWFDWGMWSFAVTAQILGGLEGKGLSSVGNYADIDMATEDYIEAPIDENLNIFKGVEFYYKARKMGLLDPDSLTQKYDNATTKFTANRVVSCPVGWVYDSANAQFQKDGKTESGYLPLPVNSESYYMDTTGPLGQTGRAYCISAECKYPDRAMDVINYLFSFEGARTIWNGVKDVNYTEENGKMVLKEETIKAQMSDANFVVSTGIQKYANYSGLGGSFIDPQYNQPVSLFMTPEAMKAKLNPLTTDYCTHYGVSYPGEVMYKQLKHLYQDGSLGGFKPQDTDDIKKIKSRIDEYMKTELVKLVLAKDDAAFKVGVKKVVEDIKKMGAEKALEFDKAAQKEALAKRAELAK